MDYENAHSCVQLRQKIDILHYSSIMSIDFIRIMKLVSTLCKLRPQSGTTKEKINDKLYQRFFSFFQIYLCLFL